jgi:hypothetical protein
MEKYLVVANFTCHDACEDDLYTSQWAVGTFNTVDECIYASLKDLGKVANDHFECILSAEEFDSEEDYYDALAANVESYCYEHWEATIGSIEIGLASGNSVELLANDFVDSEFTDQRQIVKYYMYRV